MDNQPPTTNPGSNDPDFNNRQATGLNPVLVDTAGTGPTVSQPLGPEQKKKPAGLLAVALVLLLVIVAVSAWAVLKPKPVTTPQQSSSVVPTAQVSLTDKAFLPATLSVKKGTKVTWTNQTTAPVRIAANPYPNKTELPGLDSNTLGVGQTYSYTFDKSGSYGYSDYTRPTVGGTVVVR